MGVAMSEFLPSLIQRPDTAKDKRDMFSDTKGLLCCFCSMQGWRPTQEDAHLCMPHVGPKDCRQEWSDASLFAVFDGHGGEQVAQFCARHVPEEVVKFPVSQAKVALTTAFHRMDEMLTTPRGMMELKTLTRSPAAAAQPVDPGSIGCTACVCIVRPQVLIVGNAGDSRAVLCRSGKALALSHDHKPDVPSERLRIERTGGRVVDQWLDCRTCVKRVDGHLSLSRAIGDLRFKMNPRLAARDQRVTAEPEIVAVQREPNKDEFIVLACDGVWDVMCSQAVCDYIRSRLAAILSRVRSPSSVVAELLEQCLAKTPDAAGGKGTDNMTMVLVVFTHGPKDPILTVATAGRGVVAPQGRTLLHERAPARMRAHTPPGVHAPAQTLARHAPLIATGPRGLRL